MGKRIISMKTRIIAIVLIIAAIAISFINFELGGFLLMGTGLFFGAINFKDREDMLNQPIVTKKMKK